MAATRMKNTTCRISPEEILLLIQGQLRELLSLVGEEPEDSDKRRAILSEYGNWLSARHKQEDAAVAFLAAGDLQSALAEYTEGNHWRMALSIAGNL